jgi:hypothetical protein
MGNDSNGGMDTSLMYGTFVLVLVSTAGPCPVPWLHPVDLVCLVLMHVRKPDDLPSKGDHMLMLHHSCTIVDHGLQVVMFTPVYII